VTAPDVFRDQPVLTGQLVRLEPLTLAVLEDYAVALAEPEIRRLTGARATFDRAKIEAWLATRGDQHDRADWAVFRVRDGAFLGEAVLNEVDLENESANYRVWLAGPQVFGQGYGTEITRLVVDYALGTCGLHRVTLGVYDFNPRARRVYEKCGFRYEGRRRNALLREGQWHDELLMATSPRLTDGAPVGAGDRDTADLACAPREVPAEETA
jgi:RimJ/RimL family protein N-acetyltransferase